MERITQFETGEFYHIYNRGIDKRKIFFSAGDWKHFQKLMWARNIEGSYIRADRLKTFDRDSVDRDDTLVDICAYALMDNHFHFLLKEKKEGGITKFMSKFLTSYSMYMNKKYERTGPLMCRPFRAKHVDSDEYFRWLISYIHLNPIGKIYPEFEESGIDNLTDTMKFLEEYDYSSYKDYFVADRDASSLLNKDALPIDIEDLDNLRSMLKDFEEYKFDPRMQ
ncbi:MAG: transposase [Candidatus Pacebacteria bacterium]|nr:transposase [Candidatus Paceibacterota bacterium]